MEATSIFDFIVIGGGPAGFSAAIYAARSSMTTLVIEQGMPGGQIATSDTVDNYPGIPEISGAELGSRMQQHAEAAGAQMAYDAISALTRDDDGIFHLEGSQGQYQARTVLVATGAPLSCRVSRG